MNLPSILTLDPGLLFWMALAFLVVLFILAKYGFPSMIHMVENRKSYIDDSLRKAQEATERLENINKEAETILQEAREKQSQILKEAAETRETIVEKAHAKAKNEENRILLEAKEQIEAEKQNAINDIRKQVATLSVKIAEKIMRDKLATDSEQMLLIDKMLNDVSEQKNK